jgi:signal transduction histidine kinase
MTRPVISPDRIAPWAVALVFLLITAVATAYVWETTHLSESARFHTEVSTALADIRYRLETYLNVLRAASGLFAADEDVTRDQFRAYVRSLQVQARHPGIQGIGITLRVKPEMREAVIADMRLNDFRDFNIWPDFARDEYFTIVLLEPLDERNRAAIGFDMTTNPVRREAMYRARDTGEAAASGRVRLVQEIDPSEHQPGFLIYVPIYSSRGIPETVEERRQTLYGFVYAPFRAHDLFNGMFGERPRSFHVTIHDGQELFYATADAPEKPRFTESRTIEAAGRRWTVRFASRAAAGRESMLYAGGTAAGGIVISVLLFALLRVQLRARARAEETAERLQRSEAQLQEASRAKDEFLATLSHELRTPMTAIIGWSNLLSEELDDETLALAIDSIQKSSRAQSQLIEDLLDVSRITAGKMSIDPRPLELAPIVRSAIDSISPAAEMRHVRVDVHISNAPILVRGDANRLQQVIWNLLSNAVKFTPEEGLVTVTLHRNAHEAVIEVRDTGQGIDPEFLPFVFERFRQADSSTTRSYTGLGLGLAIVHNLVELHGGTVTADSEGLEKGATFTVRLPLLDVPTSMRATDSRDDPVMLSKLHGAHVLVVDDEEAIRNYAGAVFRMSGCEVRCVDSAAAALETLRDWKADVVVTDIGMPERDGYELLRAIRSARDGIAELPVIALTAWAREEDRERIAEAGFEGFVSKPVDPGELRRAVAGAI